MEYFLYYMYLIPLFFSAVFSIKAFVQKWPRPFRYFSIFLLLTLVVEVFAILWKWGLCKTAYWNYSTSNLWIYNAFLPLRYLLLLAFFHGIITLPRVRQAMRFVAAPFLIFAAINYFFIQTPHRVSTYTIICCSTLTILACLAFFFGTLRGKDLGDMRKSSEVWIWLGTLLYHAGTLPLFIFFDYLIREHYSWALAYFHINDALNIIMSLSYLISFLCRPYSPK